MDKNEEKKIGKKLIIREVRGLERDFAGLDLRGICLQVFIGGYSGLSISTDLIFDSVMETCLVGAVSLGNYLLLRKNQEFKSRMGKFFTECYGNISQENIENYSKAIDRNNRKVTLMTLLGLTIGGMTAGYSLGEIIFQDEMKWLAGLGLGALTIYGSTKLYKNRTKRFGDKVKFKYEEVSEK